MPMNSNYFNPVFLHLMYSPFDWYNNIYIYIYILCLYLVVYYCPCDVFWIWFTVAGEEKKILVYYCRWRKGGGGGILMEIKSLKLDFHWGGIFVNNC